MKVDVTLAGARSDMRETGNCQTAIGSDRSRRWWTGLVVSAGLLAIAGCVNVPAYDSETDQLLTSLQKDTDTFIQHLTDTYDTTTGQGKACAYAANVKTYEQFQIDINLLTTRANILYNDRVTIAALGSLKSTFDSLEAAHKAADTERAEHCILPAVLATDQQAMDSAIGSVLKLELQKKGNS
jgi:hypothetical protein